MAAKPERTISRDTLPATEKGLENYLTRYKTYDGEERLRIALGEGLTLVVEPGGTKTFQARYRPKGLKDPKRHSLGHYPKMTLAKARERLAEVKAAVRDGDDPAVEAARAASGSGDLVTFDDLAEWYLSRREGKKAPKTIREERLQLDVVRRVVGKHRLVDVQPDDLDDIVQSYAAALKKQGKTAVSAKKVAAVVRRVYRLALDKKQITGGNPAASLKADDVIEKPRTRVLWDGHLLMEPARPKLNELGRFAAALLDDDGTVWGEPGTKAALLLSLLLGFRASEVAALEWSGVTLDGDDPAVTVRKSKTDAGLRTLPLGPHAVRILRDLRDDRAGEGRYVFPGGDTRPNVTQRRAEHVHPESLSRAVARACDKLGIDDVTHHDLRRTMATGLGELGHDDILPRILGHVARGVTGRHYNHARKRGPMLAALVAWEGVVFDAVARYRAALAGGAEGESGNVVTLRAAG